MQVMVDDKTGKICLLDLDWGDIFLLTSALIEISCHATSDIAHKRADDMLVGLDDAAAKSIAEIREPD